MEPVPQGPRHKSPRSEEYFCPFFVENWCQPNNRFKCLTDEVERLLRDYKQNQDFIRNLGNRFYQIIYPIQVRQRERFGVSTREIEGSYGKVRSYFHITYHNFKPTHSTVRDARDHWIQESIKRIFNSGLFWAIGAAEIKKSKLP